MLSAELAEPVEQAFAEFDAVPLAAASIGQTHRAKLHDGQRRRGQAPAPRTRRARASRLGRAVIRGATARPPGGGRPARRDRGPGGRADHEHRVRSSTTVARPPPACGCGRAVLPRRRADSRRAPDPLNQPAAGHGRGRWADRSPTPRPSTRPRSSDESWPAGCLERSGSDPARRLLPRRPAPGKRADRRRRARCGCSTSARSDGSIRSPGRRFRGSRSDSRFATRR